MYDPYRENGAELSIGVKRTHSLEDLFSRSDVVSIHAPLSSETENLISEKVLRSSKPGLILINTARGPIVDLDALYNALKNDHIEAVGVDAVSYTHLRAHET